MKYEIEISDDARNILLQEAKIDKINLVSWMESAIEYLAFQSTHNRGQISISGVPEGFDKMIENHVRNHVNKNH